jgi:hypothetical protein
MEKHKDIMGKHHAYLAHVLEKIVDFELSDTASTTNVEHAEEILRAD